MENRIIYFQEIYMRVIRLILLTTFVFSCFQLFAQEKNIESLIGGTATPRKKMEMLNNMAMHGTGKIQEEAIRVRKVMVDENYRLSSNYTSRKRIWTGHNLREKHIKPEQLLTITHRGDVIKDSAWCGYIIPTSTTSGLKSHPDLGRGWIKFPSSELENSPKVKKAFLKVLWSVGYLREFAVYKMTKDYTPEIWDDLNDSEEEVGFGKEIDVTDIVQGWVDDTDSNHGLVLVDKRGSDQFSNHPSTWKNTLNDYISIPIDGIELDVIFDIDPFMQPTYIPGTDLGYYIWKDSNGWHLRMSGGGYGSPKTFQGHFYTDEQIVNPVGVNLESGDTITTEIHRVTFQFYVDGEEDGIDFTINGTGTSPLKFVLTLDGYYQQNYIYVGQYKQNLESYPLLLQ